MLRINKLIIALTATTSLLTAQTLLAETVKPQTTTNVATTKTTAPTLIEGNWDSFNRDQINKIITLYGNTNPSYDPKNPPYAVFDWDNTSVFLDIQEALMIYQIEHLDFKMTPKQLDEVIRKNIPHDNFDKSMNNKEGKPVNIDLIAQDIVNNYQWIYDHYDKMKGKLTLPEIKATPQYKEFSTKLRYLYEAIGSSFNVSIAYPWVTYLFTGMTAQDIAKLTDETIEWQLTQPITKVTWTSPDISSKAGQVSTSWNNGLRLSSEMQDLYTKLRNSGIDVWVCSASFIDVIKEVSSNPKFGYNNPKDHVIAMELERDKDGKILPEYRKGYTQTQGPGKTVEIKRLIAPKYQNKGPILVAGDSEGDQNMFQDFDNTKVVVIINRLRNPSSDIGKRSIEAVETYKNPEAKYLLQGRDDNKGVYLPSQKSIKLGQTEAKALP